MPSKCYWLFFFTFKPGQPNFSVPAQISTDLRGPSFNPGIHYSKPCPNTKYLIPAYFSCDYGNDVPGVRCHQEYVLIIVLM